MERYLWRIKLLPIKREIFFIIILCILSAIDKVYDHSAYHKNNSDTYITSIETSEINENFKQLIHDSSEEISEDKDFIFIFLTKEGHVMAYGKNRSEIKWNLDLGSPLISSHIDIDNNNIEDIKILPGMDGFIYHTDLNSNIIEKIDVSIENLIDKSPFTLPMMKDTIFLGDKISTVYTVNLEDGKVISQITSNFTTPTIFHETSEKIPNKFIIIIRIDYIIRCYNQIVEETGLIWNMTVSEVTAVSDRVTVLKEEKEEKFYFGQGAKYLANLNQKVTNSGKLGKLGEIKIPNGDSDNFVFIENSSYTNLEDSKNFNSSRTLSEDFSKLTSRQIKNEFYEKKLIEHINNQYINYYTIFIFFLICAFCVAVCFYFQIYKKNLELKKQIKLLKKESMDNISAKSTNTKMSSENINGNTNSNSNEINPSSQRKNIIEKGIKNGKFFPKIKNNFEEDYDCDEENLSDNEISDEYEDNFEEIESDQIDEYKNLFSINDKKFSKYEDIVDNYKNRKTSTTGIEEKSFNSIRSLKSNNSLTIKNPQIKKEKIYTEEDFNKKSKLPILSENFPLKYPKSDVSSVAECLIEENDDKIIKTEVRKLVTIYTKNSNKSEKNEGSVNSHIDTNNENNQNQEKSLNSTLKNSYRITLNAKLTKENFRVAIGKEEEVSNQIQNDNVYALKNFEANSNLISNNETNPNQSKNAASNEELLNTLKTVNLDDENFKINLNCQIIPRKLSQDFDLEFSIHPKEFNLNSTLKEKYQYELIHLQEMYVEETLHKYSRIDLNQSLYDKQSQFRKILDEISDSDSEQENSEDDTFKSLNVKDEYYFNNFDTGRFLRNFEEIRIIGKGGFGCVFKARHKIDSSEYAVKIIKLKIRMNENLSELEVVKEIKTMMKLESRYVVRYVTCWFELSGDKLKGYHQEKKIRSRSSNFDLRLRKLKDSESDSNKLYINTHTKLKKNCNRMNSPNDINIYKGQKDFKELKESSLISDNYGEDYYFDSEKYKNSDIEFFNNNTSNPINFSNNAGENPQSKFENIVCDGENEPENIISNNIHFNNNETKIKLNENSVNYSKSKSGKEMFSVYFFMQMEYCNGFPLSFYLENRKRETDRNLIYILFKQILLGVIHIHEHNIIHRDLKPANILIHDYFCIKIADFGLATDKNKNPTSETELKENVGTPLYQSPEQIQGKPYNEKVDIYSLGIILIELCTLFKTQSERRIILEKTRATGEIPEILKCNYPIEYNLIKMMTNCYPLNRPSAKDIWNSAEFKKLANKFEIDENLMGDLCNY